MAEFGAEKLVLCGLSYGSWIATSFAMRHPDKLVGLVLSGGCTGMSEQGRKNAKRSASAAKSRWMQASPPADFAPAVVNVIAGPNASEAIRAQLLASMSAIPAATCTSFSYVF